MKIQILHVSVQIGFRGRAGTQALEISPQNIRYILWSFIEGSKKIRVRLRCSLQT